MLFSIRDLHPGKAMQRVVSFRNGMSTGAKKITSIRVSGRPDARRLFVRRLQEFYSVSNLHHRADVTLADLVATIADGEFDEIKSLAADFDLEAAFVVS